MSGRASIKVALILVVMAFCFYEFAAHRQSEAFREYVAAAMSLQGMLLACLAIWCGTFFFLRFGWNDWPLVILLLAVMGWYFLGTAERPGPDALMLLFGATLGKGMRFALESAVRWQKRDNLEIASRKPAIVTFLVGLTVMLALASWGHLDMVGAYRGPRWMGLWDNPNTYGMLMGAGGVLSAGLLADRRWKMEDGEVGYSSPRPSPRMARRGRNLMCSLRFFTAIKSALRNPPSSILALGTGMLGVGLVMSYSRGAWLATAVGLAYLAWCHGKLKWKYVLPASALMVVAASLLWGRTLDSAPWYVKRADLGRPSAQNRATAWRASLEIMRDHPLGVGWNNAVKMYGESYHPPEGGPAAITTNDYLMLGTELGIPALLCFVAYVGLCYRKSPRLHLTSALSPFDPSVPVKRGEGENVEAAPSSLPPPPVWEKESEVLRAACLAGALVFVVAFWFDGGLFKLPTAAMFWVLLELGAYRAPKVESERLRLEGPKMA